MDSSFTPPTDSTSVDSLLDQFNLDTVDTNSFDGLLDNLLQLQQEQQANVLDDYCNGDLSPGGSSPSSSASSDSGCRLSCNETSFELDSCYNNSNNSNSPSSFISVASTYSASPYAPSTCDSDRLTPPETQTSISCPTAIAPVHIAATVNGPLQYVTVPALVPTQIFVPANSFQTTNSPLQSQPARIQLRNRDSIGSNSSSSSSSDSCKRSSAKVPIKAITPLTNNQSSSTNASELSRSEARKLRNRQSASISRMKQKLEVESLRQENTQLKSENSSLKDQINKLKTRMVDLESDLMKKLSTCSNCSCSLTSSSSSSSSFSAKRKAISLLAVCFMISFNLSSPFSQYLSTSVPSHTLTNSPLVLSKDRQRTLPPQPSLASPLNGRMKENEYSIGRSLLWQAFDFSTGDDDESNQNRSQILSTSNSSLTPVPGCSEVYINSSESLRLDSELRGWVKRVESKQKQLLQNEWSKFPPSKSGYSFNNHNSNSNSNSNNNNNNYNNRNNHKRPLPLARLGSSLEPQEGLTLDQLIRSIDRKEDTYYFVSLLTTGDPYLLLPPVTRSNRTQDTDDVSIRPRVSFIMPALSSSNKSKSTNDRNSSFVAASTSTSTLDTLIQIDCEVMNTQLLLVKGFGDNSIGKSGKLNPSQKSKSNSKLKNRVKQALGSSGKNDTARTKPNVNVTN